MIQTGASTLLHYNPLGEDSDGNKPLHDGEFEPTFAEVILVAKFNEHFSNTLSCSVTLSIC